MVLTRINHVINKFQKTGKKTISEANEHPTDKQTVTAYQHHIWIQANNLG